MEKFAAVEITISGKKGEIELTPAHYDVKDLMMVLEQIEALLAVSGKKDRSMITHRIESGSVKHLFTTATQLVISFNAILVEIEQSKSIDFLELPTAKAFESLQEIARKQKCELQVSTSLSNSNRVVINEGTNFCRSKDIWVDSELYLFGLIVDAGGKNKANIHLDTKELGLVKIEATQSQLASYENNPLYKSYGIRVKGKQNLRTGEIDTATLSLIEIIDDYQPSYKEDYIQGLINKARKNWSDVKDGDEWLQSIRGYGA